MPSSGRTPRATQAKGVCPVCRSMQRLLNINGKVAKHGRSAAAPGGCAGSYEPPLREDRRTGSIVVGFRPGDSGPTAQGGPVVHSHRPPPPAAG